MKASISLSIAAAALLAASSAHAQSDFTWNRQVAAGQTVEIKGVNGSIHAVAAPGNQVRVIARKTATRSDMNQVTIAVVEHAGGVTLCAVYPSTDDRPNECAAGNGGRLGSNNNDVQVEWTVQLPRGVNFVGGTVNGTAEALGLAGSVRLSTVNGNLRISTNGHATGSTVNGNIDVVMGRVDAAQPTKFSTVNGSISIALAGDTNADLKVSTVSGEISSDFPIFISDPPGPKSAMGVLGRGGPELRLSTVNGSVTLTTR